MSEQWLLFPEGDHFTIVQVPDGVDELSKRPYFSSIFRHFFDSHDEAARMAEDIERYIGSQWIRMLNHVALTTDAAMTDEDYFGIRHARLMKEERWGEARQLLDNWKKAHPSE